MYRFWAAIKKNTEKKIIFFETFTSVFVGFYYSLMKIENRGKKYSVKPLDLKKNQNYLFFSMSLKYAEKQTEWNQAEEVKTITENKSDNSPICFAK